jgi:hypothetical protein
VGIVVGIVGALLVSTDEEGKTRKPVQSTVKKTKAALSGEEVRVKDWVQSAAEQAQETFGKARTQLSSKLVALKDNAGMVNKDKYTKAVSEVVAQLKSAGEVTVSQVKMLKDFLLQDYQDLTTEAKKKPVKKVAKKA